MAEQVGANPFAECFVVGGPVLAGGQDQADRRQQYQQAPTIHPVTPSSFNWAGLGREARMMSVARRHSGESFLSISRA